MTAPDEFRCGGVFTLDPDPVTMVINALAYAREQTGKELKLSSLAVALIVDSLVEQGAFRDRLRPAVERPTLRGQVQAMAELNAYLDDQAIAGPAHDCE